MAKAESPPDDDERRTETQRWYDDGDEFAATDSRNTDLDETPAVADIEYSDGTIHRGISLSFLVERAMLDPAAEVRPADES